MAIILAGLWAVLRAPNEYWRSALMHFAAAVVFAVVAMEFLPDLVEEHSIPATVVGFGLGTVAMLAVREWSSPNIIKFSQKRSVIGASLIAATAVNMVVDGLMLGVGFAAALLFLVTEELLTEAHEVEESPWLTATFFVGFLAILLLELL